MPVARGQDRGLKPPSDEHVAVVIIHNCWIHYKDLLFRALLARGIDFKVFFTARLPRQQFHTDPLRDCPYHYTVGYEGTYEDANQINGICTVWRFLNHARPRCVIISGWSDLTVWAAWAWCIIYRVPMILWCESNSFDHKRYRAIELIKRLYVRPFRMSHVYGISNREYLVELGVPERKIQIKRAVLDIRRFSAFRRQARPGGRRLIFVGRLVREKNVGILLKALSRLADEEDLMTLSLSVAGDGPERPNLEALATTLGIADKVEFLGSIPNDELPEIYANHDVLVLPSSIEPWGLVVNEAMCCGLPAIVSTHCGCAKDMVSADTGWIFEPYDVGELARILNLVRSVSEERLLNMGSAAQKLAVQYGPENCASVVHDTVRQVTKANG